MSEPRQTSMAKYRGTPLVPLGHEKESTMHTLSPRPISSTVDSQASDDSDEDYDVTMAPINTNPLFPLERAFSHPSIHEVAVHEATMTNRPNLHKTVTAATSGTTGSRMPEYEVDFEEDDALNPRNWSLWYKSWVVGGLSFATLSVVFFSTSYTSGIPGMLIDFNEDSSTVATVGVTTYLLGMACGSLVLAPLSEIYGRRPVYIGGMFMYTCLIIPCALATSLAEIIVVRFIAAVMGSCTIAMAPGSLADITNETHRALAFSIWALGPMLAPTLGPIAGGFVYQYLGWRWTNWLVMIMGGVAFIMVFFIKETYAPLLLQQKAAKKRAEMDDERYWSRYDQKLSLFALLKVNLSRPFVLTATEPILWFWDLYIAVIYGILYLCFVAYPIVFTQLRGWSAGISGLAFCGIGVGTLIAIASEPLIRRMINSHRNKQTGDLPPEAAVSIICIAAICVPVGQLWFSWTSWPETIHPAISIIAGIPFGFGNAIVFIYSANYIASSYGVYAASAMAGNSVVRSLTGGTLPLLGPIMYTRLGPQWAGTLLGLLEVVLIPIPFVFYKYGHRIRAKSPLIKKMRDDENRAVLKAEKARKRRERGLAREENNELEADAEKGPSQNVQEAKLTVLVKEERT